MPGEEGDHGLPTPGVHLRLKVLQTITSYILPGNSESNSRSVTRTCRGLPLTRVERDELRSLGVELTPPANVAAAEARRWRRPLDHACDGLLLVCPEMDTEA
jgi:hypothetical protein